jgi:hypothetical protein
MNAKTSGGIACSKAKAGDAPPLNEQRRKRGAPLGNRNAWKHGKYAAARLAAHKASTLRIRALGLIAAALGLVPARNRPLAPEQWARLDSAMRYLAWRLGLITGMVATGVGAW